MQTEDYQSCTRNRKKGGGEQREKNNFVFNCSNKFEDDVHFSLHCSFNSTHIKEIRL
jgi:hypothetical protein